MHPLALLILLFVALELSNVLLLYFMPGTKKGNGVGVFNAYEKSKADPDVHNLIRYLIYWVAGTKLIFIALLIVIAFVGNHELLTYSTIALCISITSYYWKLDPLIRSIDKSNGISPKGYSKTLRIMITAFILIFVVAILYFK